ncbi:arginase family protein [Chloroflexota bacterium]
MSYPEWENLKDHFLRGRDVPMIEDDMPTFMGQPHAKTAGDLQGADIAIIGVPYVAARDYAGLDYRDWMAAPKRVRQQSAKYGSGYLQDFGLDLWEHVRLVDYGDAAIPPEVYDDPSAENVLRAQRAVEEKVNEILDAGARPVVIGQNSPCSSYAVAKPVAERTAGAVGVVSLDTHWDIEPLDFRTLDPRIAGSNSWKTRMYELHPNMPRRNLVEIGERGVVGSHTGDQLNIPGAANRELIESYTSQGTHFYPMWTVREKGVAWLCDELRHAYDGTEAVYAHFDMDVLGGAGPAPGDLLGTLAEPMGMTDYEAIRLAFEVGKRGFMGFSLLCIPPGSEVIYRTIVYVIQYLIAGTIMGTAQSD